jgi:hypothetical protein
MRKTIAAIGMFILLACAAPAFAVNYVGKFTLVQVTSAGTRFYVQASHLSLYATGEYRDVLLEAVAHNKAASVGYTTIACPGGITGTCGNVNFVSLNAAP